MGARTGCAKCDGWGNVPVDEDYVRESLVEQGHLNLDHAADVEPVPVQATRESLRNTVRPCHVCRPDQYEQWRTGRYQPRRTTGRPRRPRKGTR